MPRDKCTSTGIFSSLGEGRDGEGERRGEKGWPLLDWGRVRRDDEQASCNRWAFDYGNIECGNEMFIRCGFEEETGGAREQGEGSDKL